ncbi:MAG: LEA type 2 family protein [Bacteroidota bacterium]
MGKLLTNIAIGLAINFALRKGSQAVSDLASEIDWEVLPVSRKDLRLQLQNGKLVAIITARLRVQNNLPVSIYLDGYRAQITQEGQPLSTLATTQRIELPSKSPRTLQGQFVVVGEQFTSRLSAILDGQGSLTAPIQFNGQLTLSGNRTLPISKQLNFFSLS